MPSSLFLITLFVDRFKVNTLCPFHFVPQYFLRETCRYLIWMGSGRVAR